MKTKEWRALIRHLREHFPVEQPVTVTRRKNLKGCHGLTTFDGTRFHIRVQSSQERSGQIDTILHEWAHVCAIEEAYTHKSRWSTLFGEIYESWTKDPISD